MEEGAMSKVLNMLAVVVMIGVLGWPGAVGAQPASKEGYDALDQFFKAMRQGRVTVALRFVTEDTVLIDNSSGEAVTYRGKQAIRGWLKEGVAQQAKIVPTSMEWMSETRTQFSYRYYVAAYTRLSLEFQGSGEIVTEGGKIKRLTVHLSNASLKKLAEARAGQTKTSTLVKP
jgi:hypothetical protein